ncbi:alpha/beta-Hydrolases superfamily protein [Rhynchospora pubera]|uniref:Alpha/beta-Hydrolases superfamily protein n=1 Tax=Rhynchospora pubera TaxID=906938 RepID=A0AAV8DMX5_9POAL|nr:alpha/beta-Hydrolases superfamily protein [Rhynchospora pubera]
MPRPGPRWWSVTTARDRCHRRSFTSAGLRPAFFPLTDGATLHIWLPASPSPSSRPALVLLHGFGARATWQWSPFLRPLIRAGFDLYVPDLLFFGDSSSPTAHRSDIYQARSVMEALKSAGLDQFGMVGISYGGFVAYQIAAMHPDAVDKLVIVSAGVCLEESDLAAGLFAVSDMAEAASLLVPQQPDDVRQLVKLTFCKPPPIMPTCFIRDYIQVMCTENVKEKTELLYALINGRKLADLPKINQETLIVWGDQDKVFPLELCHRLKRHLGDNSHLVVIKNAGHAINREKPKELCNIIKRYFVDGSFKTFENYNGHSREGKWRDCMKRFARSSIKRIDSGRPLL